MLDFVMGFFYSSYLRTKHGEGCLSSTESFVSNCGGWEVQCRQLWCQWASVMLTKKYNTWICADLQNQNILRYNRKINSRKLNGPCFLLIRELLLLFYIINNIKHSHFYSSVTRETSHKHFRLHGYL